MTPHDKTVNYPVTSYHQLRRLIGLVGISLPPVLTLGAKIFGRCDFVQPSISDYYYSIMHIVFVGLLCILGAFLITYRVKDKFENTVSNFAGAFAFCVAIFPTAFTGLADEAGGNCYFIHIIPAEGTAILPAYVSYIHYTSAGLLFLCFAIFCLKFFQRQDDPAQDGKMKDRRNTIYKICGYMIVLSIAAIGVITWYDHKHNSHIWPNFIYWLETTALIPFGFSWLLKGSADWPYSNSRIKRKLAGLFR